MAVIAFPHRDTISMPVSLINLVRRLRTRARLTDQERHYMAAARPRAALYTASLGGHPYHW
ncbi:hypothetical protein ACFXHA_19970 [Nocardia sp. NPDC059240]|uniref:hypothetical protein n=1 Tax=Nocardia sp. NPDC059240 TaxID=3346786 RepID=UPI00368CCCF0